MGKIVKSNSFICEKVWGGSKLAALKNVKTDAPIGETWEVSTHANGSSLVGDLPLSQFCSLSYIVKFIDTSDNLSIQVHPGDEYAKEHENSLGKTECWLILDSEDGAGIYLGFKPGITKKEFFNALEAKMPVDKFLNFIPVKRGDFFFLPPGSVHAIGKGVTLCEVQQACDITYRVWDWNRLGMDGEPRELHVGKARDALDFNGQFNADLTTKKKSSLLDKSEISTLAEHPDFKVQLFANFGSNDLELNLAEKDSIVLLEGAISGDFELNAMESAFVLQAGQFHLDFAPNTSFLIVSEGNTK